ncbi:MAG: PGF-CTERM sorting domain-containing protein, partial [Halobacteriales archaeon]
AERFRLATNERTEVTDVVPAEMDNLTGVQPIEQGETMVIRGVTNRNPDQAIVSTTVDDGPEEGVAALSEPTTDEWGHDGVWEVEIEVTDEVVPGNYTFEAEGVDDQDFVDVQVVGEGEAGDRSEDDVDSLREEVDDLEDEVERLRGERDELQDRIDELEDENEDLEQERDDLEEDLEEAEDEEEEQPGFTVVAALMALIAVALLAMRRGDQ